MLPILEWYVLEYVYSMGTRVRTRVLEQAHVYSMAILQLNTHMFMDVWTFIYVCMAIPVLEYRSR